MDTESGSGDLPLILAEQPAMAKVANGTTADDFERLELSIVSRVEALLSKYLGKQEEPQTSYATILHDTQDRSIVDLMNSPTCRSSMECQLYGPTPPTLEECSSDDGEVDSPSESPLVAKVIATTATTTSSLSVGFNNNLLTNGACFMAKATEVSPKPKSKYIQTADDVRSEERRVGKEC